MYVYQRKINKKRLYLVVALCMAFIVSLMGVFLQLNKPNKVASVVSEKEDVVIALPKKEETIRQPFNVEASIVLEYFDGSDHDVKDYSHVNGIYRPNQGIDYAFNNEMFDVVSMLTGEVSEVKQDPLFGNSISIMSQDVIVTYQSLDPIKLKKGDKVTQGDVVGKASANAYNPELANHVHIVVSKNNQLVNPKVIIGKTINEMK